MPWLAAIASFRCWTSLLHADFASIGDADPRSEITHRLQGMGLVGSHFVILIALVSYGPTGVPEPNLGSTPSRLKTDRWSLSTPLTGLVSLSSAKATCAKLLHLGDGAAQRPLTEGTAPGRNACAGGPQSPPAPNRAETDKKRCTGTASTKCDGLTARSIIIFTPRLNCLVPAHDLHNRLATVVSGKPAPPSGRYELVKTQSFMWSGRAAW